MSDLDPDIKFTILQVACPCRGLHGWVSLVGGPPLARQEGAPGLTASGKPF